MYESCETRLGGFPELRYAYRRLWKNKDRGTRIASWSVPTKDVTLSRNATNRGSPM